MKALRTLWGLTLMLAAAAVAEPQQFDFKRVPLQYIAALGDPSASSGNNAEQWGIWRIDPGPRGVRLKSFERQLGEGVAPAGWQFNSEDWWLEENGLIMEAPDFPLPAGHYVVTGDREVITVLTVYPPDTDGAQRWELLDGTLADVTHLPCRSARYTSADGSCSPANADPSQFRVPAGAAMPEVPGCEKQDYAVLFIVGMAVPR